MTMRAFKFKGEYHRGIVRIQAGHYANKRLAWRVLDAMTDELILQATVNLPDYADSRLDDGSHVLIKDWAENRGTLASLVLAGLVEDTGEMIPTACVVAHLCRVVK